MRKKLPINKSEVMKEAWRMFKSITKISNISFAKCLRNAWKTVKANAVEFIGQVELLIDGAYVTVMTATGYVEGNTYKAKEGLKKFGLVWNRYERVWEGTPSQIQELCKWYY